MAGDPQAAALAAVLADLRDDASVLTRAVDAARSTGRPAKALPEHEVRRHIHSLLDAIIAMLRANPLQIQEAALAADGLAVDRARQGISLEVLLDGVHSARSVLLTAVIAAAEPVMTPAELLPHLVRLDAAANLLQNRMIVSYQRAEHDQGRTRRQAQVEALRELLGGGPVSWAQEAALELQGAYHCIVADVSTPTEARRLEPLIDGGTGISGIVHGYLSGISTKLPPPDRLGGVLAVASPLVSIDQVASAYQLCREALPLYRAQRATGVQALTGAGLAVATAGRPALGRILCDELLGALDPDEEFHRLLAETVLVYIAEGNRTERAAAALHVHPNTVKYRLKRFTELTGTQGDADSFGRTLAHAVNWWWALTTWLSDAQTPGSAGGSVGGAS